MKELKTDRLVLRRICPEDAALLHQQQGCDPAITQYTGWNPYRTLDAAKKKILEDLACCQEKGFYSWVLTHRGRAVGTLGAYNYEPALLSIEIGYTIFRSEWGNGFASEAVAEAVRYLFEEEQYDRIHAWCHAENRASARVLEKAGLHREQTLVRALQNPDGSFSDQEVYGVPRCEWKPQAN